MPKHQAGFILVTLMFLASLTAGCAQDTYRKSSESTTVTKTMRNNANALYYNGPMQVFMAADASKEYFLVHWTDDGNNIWLDLQKCSLRGEEPTYTAHTAYLPDFARLANEVKKLPANTVLFYGCDDVAPISDALTVEEILELNELLKKKGGRLCVLGCG